MGPVLLMVNGHELHLAGDADRADAGALVEYGRRREIDYVDLTPSQAGELVSQGLLDSGGGHVPSVVVLGGEKIPPSLWQAIRRVPGTAFFNAYGPTEATVEAVRCQLRADDSVPPLGRPRSSGRGLQFLGARRSQRV